MGAILSLQLPKAGAKRPNTMTYLRVEVDGDTDDLRSDLHDALERLLDDPRAHTIAGRFTPKRD